MRKLHLLILLCALALAFGVALVKPLPSRADPGELTPTPDPTPTNTDPIVPQLPVVHATPVRRPAAVLHRALHIPLGDKVVKYAKHLLGVRYVFGVRLAHSSFAQFTSGLKVNRGALHPGDLVFFDGEGHVGIYVGDGRFIHAPHSGTRVRIEQFGGWYSSRFDGARRLVRWKS